MRQFDTNEFWEKIDLLSEEERKNLLEKVGGEKLLRFKFHNKKRSASRYNLKVELSLLDYAALLTEASIVASDVYKGGYNLARVGDIGDYCRKNCRFIPYAQNCSEKRTSDKLRQASRLQCAINSRKGHETLGAEKMRQNGRELYQRQLTLNPNFCREAGLKAGEKHRGGKYANNGFKNIVVSRGDAVPQGFTLGRLVKKPK